MASRAAQSARQRAGVGLSSAGSRALFRSIGAAEADERLRVRDLVAVAPARAQVDDAAIVAAAAQDAPAGHAAQLVVADDTAGHRVCLRAIGVSRLPLVEHELPDVAGHVVQAEPIRWVAADRRG